MDDSGSTASEAQSSADLSVIASRAAYIDANLTQIIDTTPKQFTYMQHADAAHCDGLQPQSTTTERLQRRVEALERENRRWADQYQLAAKQNQALQGYIQQLQPSTSSPQPPPSTDAPPPPPAPHPRDSLYRSLLSENAALLERYDSLQRRCRVQEQMLDTRNQALHEFQRIFAHIRQSERSRAAAAAPHPAPQSAQVAASALHSRQLSVESDASDRSSEQQLVDSIDALLTRPPRLFLSPPTASSKDQHSEEEVKQADDEQPSHSSSLSSSHTSSPASRVSHPPSRPKPNSLARRLQKPALTVSAAKPPPSSSRLLPHSPPSPTSRSPPVARSAVSAASSTSSTSPSTDRARSSSAAALRPSSRPPPARPPAPSLRPPLGAAGAADTVGKGAAAPGSPRSARSSRSPRLMAVAEGCVSKGGGKGATSGSKSASASHSAADLAKHRPRSAGHRNAAFSATTEL